MNNNEFELETIIHVLTSTCQSTQIAYTTRRRAIDFHYL